MAEKAMELLLFTCMLNGDSVDGKRKLGILPGCQSSLSVPIVYHFQKFKPTWYCGVLSYDALTCSSIDTQLKP